MVYIPRQFCGKKSATKLLSLDLACKARLAAVVGIESLDRLASESSIARKYGEFDTLLDAPSVKPTEDGGKTYHIQAEP